MNMQRERPPFSTISGTMIRLGERETIAIYCRDDLSWVAHFRDGQAELSDAATWYRANAAWLRARQVGTPAKLRSISTLTPEMIERIRDLHRRRETKDASRTGASVARTFARAFGAIASKLRRLRIRLIHRVG